MKIVQCLYICLVIALVHSNNTTPSYKITKANFTNTILDGNGRQLSDIPTVSEKLSNVSSINKTENILSDGKPKHFRAQIDVPFKGNNQLKNNTQHYVLLGQRRGVLIINRRMSRQNQGKIVKPSKAESLLYEEYSDDGSKVYSYAMSNLDDVAKFFQYYLNTHICHGSCDLLPTTASLPPKEALAEK